MSRLPAMGFADGALAQPQEHYHALLLDLTMPRISGLQLIHILQQQKAALLNATIVTSGDPEALQEAKGLGMCHCLPKPFDLNAVLEQLSLVLSHPSSQVAGSQDLFGEERFCEVLESWLHAC